jgi:non-heme chloroperoxidase
MNLAYRFACLSALLALSVTVHSQVRGWTDPSPHKTQFVAVEPGIKLEVLDWGGSGRSLVLLAGGGDTAHVYDDFAPKLTSSFHVYGITRRGFGASGFSAADWGADRLGDDVLAVLSTVKVQRPILVGHSLAGEELSSIGSRFPERVAGLIYLDAGYSYAFDDGTVPSLNEFQSLKAPESPEPTEADLGSFAVLQKYYLRVLGFTYPEAELRQRRTSASDGRVGSERDFPGYKVILQGMKKFRKIPVPSLVIFANPHSLGKWVDDSTDPKILEAAKAYTSSLGALTTRQADAFQKGVPTAHIVCFRAHHYVYLSNEADVLREIWSFVNALK